MKTLPHGHLSLLSPDFKYTPASATSIARTFARLKRARQEEEKRAQEDGRHVIPLKVKRG